MTSHRRRPPLLVRPRRSRLLAGFVVLSHLLAASIALALPLDWTWHWVLVALICSSAAWNALTHLWPRTPWSVREAALGEGGWEVTLGSGARRTARLAPSTFVGTRLMVLNFRCAPWLRCSLVLLPDGLDADTRRRLRVRLRLAGAEPAAAQRRGRQPSLAGPGI
jgi:toxin CptA